MVWFLFGYSMFIGVLVIVLAFVVASLSRQVQEIKEILEDE